MSSNFEGTWVVTQKWGQTPQYSFNMDVSANGRITIEGGFVGTIIQLGQSTQVSMAIGNSQGDSISSYVGNVVGDAMGGEALGTSTKDSSSATVSGTWSAMLQSSHSAPKEDHSIPTD